MPPYLEDLADLQGSKERIHKLSVLFVNKLPSAYEQKTAHVSKCALLHSTMLVYFRNRFVPVPLVADNVTDLLTLNKLETDSYNSFN